MIYQHRFLHVFMSLLFFYVVAFLILVSIYLLIAAKDLYFEIMTKPYVWMLYAPGPLFIGMSVSLFCAGVVQWIYRCKVEGEKIIAKNTWGKVVIVNPKDIIAVRSYEIPFMPLVRIKLENAKWAVWVPKKAALEAMKISKNLPGNVDVTTS